MEIKEQYKHLHQFWEKWKNEKEILMHLINSTATKWFVMNICEHMDWIKSHWPEVM